MDPVVELISALLEDVSKSELARRSGVSRSLIDDYLGGRCQPTVRQLRRLGASTSRELEMSWRTVERETPPQWARPNAAMAPPPLTVAERAQVLRRVTDVAMAFRRKEPGALTFPPFRTFFAESAT